MRPTMVELEVRCCCQPTKLYGYLQIAAEDARRGHVVSIPVRSPAPDLRQSDAAIGDIELQIVRFEVEEVISRGQPYLALKYEGEQPPAEKLALLKRLRGFSPL